MEQVYWLSPSPDDSDTRTLHYRYGNFVYSGQVVTEPVRGLEYLPGVLAGIQAVQGQVPYLCEVGALEKESPQLMSLLVLQRAMDAIHAELEALMDTIAAKAAIAGNEWIDGDDPTYFEFEALPGYECGGAEVIFAKSYRGELMLSVIWYAPHACFYATLSPASSDEQTLVDTAFPQIYGKRRGLTLKEYDAQTTHFFDERDETTYVIAVGATVGVRPPGRAAEESKESEDAPPPTFSDPSRLFTRASIWEASDDVPDPEALRLRDEAEDALLDDDGDFNADVDGHADDDDGPTVDVTGGEGYTQVYFVMAPSVGGPRTEIETDGGIVSLIPRRALFRYGSWVYAGEVDFPVELLRLGDVPFVLPALQKQQGRLAFVSDALAFPLSHPLAPALTSFMAAVGVLKAEMEDALSEVSELAQQAAYSWIDEDSAASFFELSFQPGSVSGVAPSATGAPGSGLAGAEVIAAKIYLTTGTGLILHVVWWRASLFCVLADNTDDLPLLDVAFPDVTARNRVVEVRNYAERTATKLADAFPGAPLPRALRVWEGRRKIVPAEAEDGKESDGKVDDEIPVAGKAVIEEPVTIAPSAAAPVDVAPTATLSGSGSKPVDIGSAAFDGDLYDVGASKSVPVSGSAAAGGGSAAPLAGMPAGGSTSAAPARAPSPAAGGSNFFAPVSRAPHHVAPLTMSRRDAPTTAAAVSSHTETNRLLVGATTASDSKDDAPWDARGAPKKL